MTFVGLVVTEIAVITTGATDEDDGTLDTGAVEDGATEEDGASEEDGAAEDVPVRGPNQSSQPIREPIAIKEATAIMSNDLLFFLIFFLLSRALIKGTLII